MRLSTSLARLLAALAVLAVSSIAGLAMASVQAPFGADLLARWLTGWAAAAVLLAPAILLVRRTTVTPTVPVRRLKRPVRHPGRLG